VSRKNEEQRELWRRKIAQQEQSGQSVRAFCREQDIGEHLFYYWRQRLRKEDAPVRFALVEMQPGVATQPKPIELLLGSGDRIHIPSDAATLRLVLSVLREQ
jgi:transposase-like protein